jgi:uncharacterized protein YegL
MSWAETMKGNAIAAALAHVADDASITRRTQTASWNPFEVWLTRIKQPRDNAANSTSASTSHDLQEGP